MTSLHIAIIPDGNRRWARTRSLAPWKGHEKSAATFENLLDWCRDDPRIGVFTIWVFSTENWKRDPKEVEKLMNMFQKYLTEKRETFHKRRTRLLHSGRCDRLSPKLRQLLEDIQEETADYSDFTLHLALDYGGKDEIIRAIHALENTKDVDEDTLQSHLDQPGLPDIDLIIRTSGEQRTSNFFLWQTTYAEWLFIDKLFPDFSTEDLAQAVENYTKRHRRFGG